VSQFIPRIPYGKPHMSQLSDEGAAKPNALEVLFMCTQATVYRSKGLGQEVTLSCRGAVWALFQTPISNFYRPPRVVNPV
jgi:hypothetical protein